MSEYFMKQPCKHCPFRNDVKPFLHPERAEEIAYSTQNPYNSFPCHKTTVSDEEFGGDGSECVAIETTKECAGFLTMRAQLGEDTPEGFEPSYEICYIDPYEMIEAYEIEWNKTHKQKRK